MPSIWRYFCCICEAADDKRSHSARYEFTNRVRNNRRNKSGKNTWARRSLLDHEHIELNDISSEQYQMKANEDSFQGRLQNHYTPRQRPPVQGVFENSLDDSSASKTTFPWMDECFVPSSRNGTRLGISSVQLNAKRNEGTEGKNVATDMNKRMVKPNIFTPYAKSQSFTDGQERQLNRNLNVTKSSNVNKNYPNVQNGHVLRNNFNTAPAEAKNYRRPVSLGLPGNYRDKPMVLRAPSSDVGVRQVSLNNSKSRPDNVPKLEDYAGKSSSSYVHSRPTIKDIFPSNDVIDGTGSEVEADVSYASEIIFRKQPSDHSSEVSLKRSDGPGMFSTNSNKYERLKPERSKSDKSKTENVKTKGKYSNLSSDSMYGYVPKVVQNVHASNALEGTKIDDFFMQRMHERQLEDFGAIDNAKAKEDSEDETVIITSLVGSTENLNAMSESEKNPKVNDMTIGHATTQLTNKAKHKPSDSESTKATEQNPYTNNGRENNKEVRKTDMTAEIGSNTKNKVKEYGNFSATNNEADMAEGKLNKIHHDVSGNVEHKANTIHKVTAASSNKGHNNHVMHKTAKTGNNIEDTVNDNDKYEDQVIMIDFPPNSETDKMTPILTKKTRSSVESGSGVSKRSSASVTSKIANGEVLY